MIKKNLKIKSDKEIILLNTSLNLKIKNLQQKIQKIENKINLANKIKIKNVSSILQYKLFFLDNHNLNYINTYFCNKILIFNNI